MYSIFKHCFAILLGVCLSTISFAQTADFSGSPTTICPGNSVIWTNTSTTTGTATYTWSFPGSDVTSSTDANPSSSVYSTPGVYSVTLHVKDDNGTNTKTLTNYITILPAQPASPGSITGSLTVCNGQTSVSYSIAAVANATSYNWIVPTGASITNGANTNSITVTFGSTSGNVCVTAQNSCGTSSPSCKSITVDVNSVVGTIGAITGSTTICPNASTTYSISAVANATNYSWSAPTGATVTAGQGTNTATITFGTNTGSVCVTANNGCSSTGQSCLAVTMQPSIPATPGPISGITSVCKNTTNVTYSVPSVPNVSTYSWSVPGDATIQSGQGTQTITVMFGSASGSVCATASNSCGTSSPSCQSITVDPNLAVGTLGNISGSTTICPNQSTTYSVTAVANATNYIWTVPNNTTITGQGTNIINVTFGSNGGNVCVTANNGCSSTMQKCLSVTMQPGTPSTPGSISGSATVCNGESGVVYTVSTVTNATTYIWTLPAGATITNGSGTRSITVAFGSSSGNICVSASNSCGTSSQNCKAITVDPNPEVGIIGNINGTTTICPGQNATYSIASVNNATNYTWTTPSGGTVTAGQGTNTVTISFGNNSGNVCVTANNGCSSTAQKCLYVNVQPGTPSMPGTISGSSTVCAGETGVIYTVGSVANATIYNWTLPTGASITNGSGTRSITVTFGSTSGSVCVTAGNNCGISSLSCKAITVDPNPAVGSIGTIVGATSVCPNSSSTYTIAAVDHATNYTWTTPVGGTVTAGQGTNTVTISFGNNSGNVCVTANNGCSSTAQKCLAVTLKPGTPATPGVITGPTTVCASATGIEYSINTVASTTTYIWMVPAGATITSGLGTRSITVTFGASSGSVCVTAQNDCGTSSSSCKAITVDPNPQVDTIKIINGPKAVCANQGGLIFSTPAVTGATTYSWTVPTGANITAGQGTNSITVTFGTNSGNICVTASNSCSSTPKKCITVTVSSAIPSIPGTMIGLTTVCNGQSGVTYSVSSVTNATTYNWTVPNGATVTAGQGTNSISVTYGATSGTVCVSAGNACGTSLGSCKIISVDPNPQVDTIGVISGPSAVCANQSGIQYSVAAVKGATTYTWAVPNGATITAGQGTNSITVTFTTNAGNVCVKASNSCSSTSTKCIAVSIASTPPINPGAMTGPTIVCSVQKGVKYSVNAVSNAASYTWTLPPGATITSGLNTNSITINFGIVSGTICVTASNGCGTSTASCKSITVDPNNQVDTIGVISGPKNVCASQTSVTYSILPVNGAASYTWTVPTGATIKTGQGTTDITVDFGANGGNVCVTANNSCSTSPQQCLTVGISSVIPGIPGAINGPTTVCNSQRSVKYSVASVANATEYTWAIPNGASITGGQETNSITVTFGSSSGQLCVTAGNGCGTSAAKCQTITVNPSMLAVTTTATLASCGTCCDGSATANANGGTQNYTYSWNTNPVQSTQTATGLCAKRTYTVCVTDAIGCVTCDTINIPFTVGINIPTTMGDIHIFPNPADEFLYVEGSLSSAAHLQINILNMFGQKMGEQNIYAYDKFSEKLDITSLPTGMYFIQLKVGDTIKTSRFMKIQ